MLTLMRRLAGTWVAKAFFLLLIVSFGFWGVEDMLRNFGRDTAVARVGDQAIELEEAQAAARRELGRLSRQLGAGFEPDDNIRRAVAAQALDSLVLERSLRLEARREHILVNDDAVREFLANIPAFRGPDGRVNREAFNAFLRTNEMSEPQFLAMVRFEMARQQLSGAVRGSATAPAALARPLLAWQRERRTADIAFFELLDAAEPEAPTEAQLRRFHENNPQRFSTPEYRDIALAALITRGITDEVQVSDEQIAEAYEQRRRTQFETPEKRTLHQIVVPTEEAARAIAEALRAGATQDAITAQVREAGGQATTLPDTERSAIPFPALAEAAFTPPAGGISDPVRGPFGWVVYKVEAVEAGHTRPLSEVRDEVRFEIAYDRALDIGYERANRIEDALAGSQPLAEIARANGMVFLQARLDAQGHAAQGPNPELPGSVAMHRDMLRAIFAAQQGNAPRLTETLDGWYAFEVREIIPPALRPFESVEAEVRQAWMTDARRREQEAKAARLLAAVQGGKALPEAAQELGFTANRFGPFGREAVAGSAVPQELLAPIFEMRPGAVTMIPTRSGFAVAQLVEVVPFDPDSDAEALSTVRREAEQRMAEDLDTQYMAALRSRANVRINPTRSEQIIPR